MPAYCALRPAQVLQPRAFPPAHSCPYASGHPCTRVPGTRTTCMPAPVCVSICIYMHMYIFIYIYTHTSTYLYTCMYMLCRSSSHLRAHASLCHSCFSHTFYLCLFSFPPSLICFLWPGSLLSSLSVPFPPLPAAASAGEQAPRRCAGSVLAFPNQGTCMCMCVCVCVRGGMPLPQQHHPACSQLPACPNASEEIAFLRLTRF